MRARSCKETQAERILDVLADGGWHALPDFGSDAYTARNRISELRARGVSIEGRKREGERIWEYRQADLEERLERENGQRIMG